jgi:ribulose-5-phosphate 4-epimerase/fuculose-1-phosphate aldolase
MSETRPVFLGKKDSDVHTHTQIYQRTSLLACIHTYPNYAFFLPQFCERSMYGINVGFISKLWCCYSNAGKSFLRPWVVLSGTSRGSSWGKPVSFKRMQNIYKLCTLTED